MKHETLWQFTFLKWLLLALLFFVPLIVSPTLMFPFTTGKSLIVVMSTAIAGALYLWVKIREQSFLVTPIKVVLGVFSIVLVLSSIYAVVPHFSFFGGFEGMSAILILSTIALAVLLGGLMKRGVVSMAQILWVSVASSLLVVWSVWADVIANKGSDSGFLGNSSYTGAYLLITVFFAFALLLQQKALWQKILASISLLIMGTSPILFNREVFKGVVSFADIFANPTVLGGVANGAVIGIAIGLVAVLALFGIRSQKNVLKIGGILLFVGMFAGLWWAGQSLMKPESALHQIYVADKNANRFVFWDIAAAGIQERPLLGWGINGYSYVFQEYFDPVLFSSGHAVELWTNNPHNMIWEYAVSTGMVGVTVYIILLGATGITLFRASRNESQRVFSIVLFGALLGYVVQNLFVFDTVVPLMLFYVIIGYAISQEKGYQIQIPQNIKFLSTGIIGVGMAACVYVFWFAGVLPWKESNTQALRIIKDTVAETPSTQLISGMGYAGDSALFGGKVVGALRGGLKDLSEEQKARITKHTQTTIEEIRSDIVNDKRDNFRGQWVMAQLSLKQIELTMTLNKELSTQAQKHFQNALAINPNNPALYHDIAQGYAYERDYKSAQKWIRASIALAPEYKVGYQYAQQLIDKKLSTPEFNQYVSEMHTRWCVAGSACAVVIR